MTRGLQTVFAGAIALGLAHPLLPQMQKLPPHWGRDDHRAGVEYRAARRRGQACADVRAHIHSGWRAAHQRGESAGGFFETPASLACVYQLVTAAKTCNPSTATTVSHGGAHAIALVDAYDDPNAASDLAVFSTEFGLPAANFQVVYAAPGSSTATNTPPPQDSSGGWESRNRWISRWRTPWRRTPRFSWWKQTPAGAEICCRR